MDVGSFQGYGSGLLDLDFFDLSGYGSGRLDLDFFGFSGSGLTLDLDFFGFFLQDIGVDRDTKMVICSALLFVFRASVVFLRRLVVSSGFLGPPRPPPLGEAGRGIDFFPVILPNGYEETKGTFSNT